MLTLNEYKVLLNYVANVCVRRGWGGGCCKAVVDKLLPSDLLWEEKTCDIWMEDWIILMKLIQGILVTTCFNV